MPRAAGPARVALVGAGWWSQGWHLPQLNRNPDASLVAIVEPCAAPRAASILKTDLNTPAELAKRYNVPIFDSFDALLADTALMSTVDGVIVACSHAAHAEVGIKALAAGKHVLVEKPMTTEVKEAKELAVAAAAAPTLACMVNNSANWRPQLFEAHKLCSAGELGEIHHVHCAFHSPLLWFFDDPDNTGWVKPTGTMAGNGFGWGQLSHLLAWVFKVTGLIPDECYSIMKYSDSSGADVTNAALIKCANGASISLSGTCVWPGNEHLQATGKHVDVRIFGDKGVIMYTGDDKDPNSGRLELRRMDGSEGHISEGFLFENTEKEGFGPESVLNFLRACRAEEYQNGADANVGLQAVRTLDAMYRSSRSGKPEPMA